MDRKKERKSETSNSQRKVQIETWRGGGVGLMDTKKDKEQQREKAEGGRATDPEAKKERDGAGQKERDEGEADELRCSDRS